MRLLYAPIRNMDGSQRHTDTDKVSQHVTGIGEQRQRIGDDCSNHLDGEEHRQDRHHGPEPAGVTSPRPDRNPMGMPVSVGIIG
ncbi:unannotated protein [freshwater metagenome]|uniref:Unannotated protein n=1 Tax=freshwater metagenome TaxID=449393 RepID=A0A6J6DT58_9ZZZZ